MGWGDWIFKTKDYVMNNHNKQVCILPACTAQEGSTLRGMSSQEGGVCPGGECLLRGCLPRRGVSA